MTTNDDRKRPSAAGTPKRRRFRLEKLEERIAPTPHTNPQTNMVGGGNGGGNNGNGNGNGSNSGSLFPSGGGSLSTSGY